MSRNLTALAVPFVQRRFFIQFSDHCPRQQFVQNVPSQLKAVKHICPARLFPKTSCAVYVGELKNLILLPRCSRLAEMKHAAIVALLMDHAGSGGCWKEAC